MNSTPLVAKWRLSCGYAPANLARLSGGTRLFHDIGLYGDNAADELKILHDEFGVDFSSFNFRKYFPGNFGLEALFLTLAPKSKWADGIRQKYPPITFDMLEEAIHKQKWAFD